MKDYCMIIFANCEIITLQNFDLIVVKASWLHAACFFIKITGLNNSHYMFLKAQLGI